MVKTKKILLGLVVSLLISCSSILKKDQEKVQALFLNKEYDQSLSYIAKSENYAKKNNIILKKTEEAKLLFQKGMYYESSELFKRIIEIIEEKYTKSITKEAFVLMTNDQNADFIPDFYEQSFIYLYQSMNFVMIWQNGKLQRYDDKKIASEELLSTQEKAQYLSRARAMMLAWDSFNKNIKRTFDFKAPLLSEIAMNQFAAKIHELFRNKKEAVIAIDLLIESFEKLSIAKKKNLLLDFDYDESLKEIAIHIESLAKRYQKGKLKDYAKRFNFSEKNKEESKLKTTLFVEHKAKSQLVSTSFSYTLNSAISSMEDGSAKSALKQIGIPLLTYFATHTLGLGYFHRTGNMYIHVGNTPLDSLAGEVGIEFYLPTYNYKEKQSRLKYVIKKKDSKEVVFEKIASPFVPLDIISLQMNKEKVSSSFTKIGARVGAKYVAAIIAAYTTYKSLNSQDNPLASTFALGQYVLSSKAIKESEQADIRYWVTLPRDLYSIDLSLEAGEYQLEVYSLSENKWDKLEYSSALMINDSYGKIIPLHF